VKNPGFFFAVMHLGAAVRSVLGGANACNSHVSQQRIAV
jgi:hypothetical protein